MTRLSVKGNTYPLPLYLPDATRAVTRSLESDDLRAVGIDGVVINTYHLMHTPGTSVIEQAGGVKPFMRWDGLTVSDSGGFQILSLVYEKNLAGQVRDDGVVFYEGSKNRKKNVFSPEKSIQVQFALGSDVVICLDDCPSMNAKRDDVALSVERTIEWAKRSKEEFQKQTEKRKLGDRSRPLLFAVVQGGGDKHLREQCARALQDIGFDGYAFGGWPMNPKTQKLDAEILRFTASLMPNDKPKFALGVGTPQDIVDGFFMGYSIFDCVLPTRDARHGRLYVFPQEPDTLDLVNDKVFAFMDLTKEKFTRDFRPVSEYCRCPTCRKYSRAYLHHLYRIEETAVYRLATLHNLWTYSKIIGLLRALNNAPQYDKIAH